MAIALGSSRLTLAVICLSLSPSALRLATLFTFFAIVSSLPVVGTRFSSWGTTRSLVTPGPRGGLSGVVRLLRCGGVSALPAVATPRGTGSRFSNFFIGCILLFVGHFVHKAETWYEEFSGVLSIFVVKVLKRELRDVRDM